MTLLRLLDANREWWRTEQDFAALPRIPFRDPTSPYIFRLACHRGLPAFHSSGEKSLTHDLMTVREVFLFSLVI